MATCFECGKELPTHYDADKKYPRSYAKEAVCFKCRFKKSEEIEKEVKQWVKDNPTDPALQARWDARAEAWARYNNAVKRAKEVLDLALKETEVKNESG